MAYQLVLLDDDVMLLESLRDLVPWGELGFDVAGAFTDSIAALEFLKDNDVNVLITDVCMPHPDGVELSGICCDSYPDLKIIFLSAHRDFEYAQAAVHLGNVVDYITKPLNYDVLKKRMKELYFQLEKESEKNFFSSETELDQRLQFFSGLLCGEIQSVDELVDYAKGLDINIKWDKMTCTTVNFRIRDFSELVQRKGQYNAIQMHHAISNLIPFETKDGYFSLAIYSYGNLVWIILHKTADVEKVVFEFRESFIQKITDTFKIDISFKGQKTYSSILDFIEQPLTEEMELDEEKSNISIALSYMEEHFAENINLNDVARRVYMCSAYFSSYFKRCTGQNFIERLTSIRMEQAGKLLKESDLSIANICIETGYRHVGNFHEKFKKYFGMTPAEYRKQYR